MQKLDSDTDTTYCSDEEGFKKVCSRQPVTAEKLPLRRSERLSQKQFVTYSTDVFLGEYTESNSLQVPLSQKTKSTIDKMDSTYTPVTVVSTTKKLHPIGTPLASGWIRPNGNEPLDLSKRNTITIQSVPEKHTIINKTPKFQQSLIKPQNNVSLNMEVSQHKKRGRKQKANKRKLPFNNAENIDPKIRKMLERIQQVPSETSINCVPLSEIPIVPVNTRGMIVEEPTMHSNQKYNQCCTKFNQLIQSTNLYGQSYYQAVPPVQYCSRLGAREYLTQPNCSVNGSIADGTCPPLVTSMQQLDGAQNTQGSYYCYPTPELSQGNLIDSNESTSTPSLPESLRGVFDTDNIREILNIDHKSYHLTEKHVMALAIVLDCRIEHMHELLRNVMNLSKDILNKIDLGFKFLETRDNEKSPSASVIPCSPSPKEHYRLFPTQRFTQ